MPVIKLKVRPSHMQWPTDVTMTEWCCCLRRSYGQCHGQSTTDAGFRGTHTPHFMITQWGGLDYYGRAEKASGQQGLSTCSKCLSLFILREKLSNSNLYLRFILVHSKLGREAFKFNWLENLVILFFVANRCYYTHLISGISGRFTCQWFGESQGNWLIAQ